MTRSTIESQLPVNLDDWLCYLSHQHHSEIDLGLTRISQVADKLKLRDFSVFNTKVVLIAGTNGKGTTSRFIESYLLHQGFSVGVFNSPHLIRYNECVRINAQELDDDQHIAAFSYIESQRGKVSLTPFEYHTLAAFYLFSQHRPDVVLIEVGMGGRLDSTNVIEPDISVLTSVGIDHQAFLGEGREAIGFEKAGIFRCDKPAIVGELDIPQSVIKQANTIGCHLLCAQQDYRFESTDDHWQWQGLTQKLQGLPLSTVPIQNLATGLVVLEALDVALCSQSVSEVLTRLKIEGRMQWLSQKPAVLLDVAHNVQAAQYLASQLRQFKQDSVSIHAVVGILKDKDIDGIIAKVAPLVDKWYLCQLDTPRSCELEQLRQAVENTSKSPYSCYLQVTAGLASACEQLAEDDIVVVFGSFYTVAAVMAVNAEEY